MSKNEFFNTLLVQDLHPYQTPSIVANTGDDVSATCQDWVLRETRSPPAAEPADP